MGNKCVNAICELEICYKVCENTCEAERMSRYYKICRNTIETKLWLKKKRIILKRLIVRLKQKERNNNNKLRKGIIVVRTFYYLTTILYITANCKLLANICNIFREISLLQ